MTRLLEFIAAILIVVVLFVVVALFLPAKQAIEHTAETNRPVRIVFDTLNSFKRFADWHPMRLHDPNIRYTVSGPDFGVGARLDYASDLKRIGSGSWEIIDNRQEGRVQMVRYALQNDAYGDNKTMRFNIERRGRTTVITQRYDVEYGWNLLGRYAGMYIARSVGEDMKTGLSNLGGLFATIPNYDYGNLTIETVEIPAQNVLYVPTTSDRNITAVETAMINQLKWIRQVMAKNDLEAAGPFRLVTTNFGTDVYEFDVVMPVRRKGTGPAVAEEPAAEEAGEGEGGAEEKLRPGAEALPPAAEIDPESIKLEGEVKFGQSYAGRALKTVYNGHPAGLPVVRDQLRAWAATRGEVVHDRAFEEYLQDIEGTAAEDSQFNVYWPIR